jgi:hypothetical protein
MSELSSINENIDGKTPSPSFHKKNRKKVNLDWELLDEEDIFVGTKSPIGKSALLPLKSPISSKFKFGAENLGVSSTFTTSLQPQPRPTHSSQTPTSWLSSQTSLPSSPTAIRPIPKLEVQSSSAINIKGRMRRSVVLNTEPRDPVEEFFTLTVQSVKLNSPYIDKVARVSTIDLYKKAQQEQVPFNKWYLWIESQFTSAYINDLFALR